MPSVGREELLKWAAETSGIRSCTKYADLSDGAVLLALANHVFQPASASAFKSVPAYGGMDSAKQNWDALQRIIDQQLPRGLIDCHAVATGKARQCFNALVIFYFLSRLKCDANFCVDFSSPVDSRVAEFLQSPQSLVSIGKFSAPSLSSSLAAAAATGTHREGADGVSAHCSERAPPTVAPGALDAGPLFPSRQPGASCSEALDISGCREQLRRLQARNAELQEELDNERAASRLLLAQQRILVATEIASMTEQLEAQLLILRQQRDQEIRKCSVNIRGEYDALASQIVDAARSGETVSRTPCHFSGKSGDDVSSDTYSSLQRLFEGKFRSMERELGAADSTIHRLRAVVNNQQERLGALQQKIRQICSVVAPTAAAEYAGFVDALLAPLQGEVSQVLVDTIGLRLKSAYAGLKGMRYLVERQCQYGASELREAAGTGNSSAGTCSAFHDFVDIDAAVRESAERTHTQPTMLAGDFFGHSASGVWDARAKAFGAADVISASTSRPKAKVKSCVVNRDPRDIVPPLETHASSNGAAASTVESSVYRSGSTASGADPPDATVLSSTAFGANRTSSLLSVEELERRKAEIMRRCDLSNT
ncbi:unnamed protein product [Trypanosoma congolense IL3000]|uniref:WGS project CAEQ00000000 data, annotated contig 1431 n=1 Tax=Trypanosoma congolense (strain IL3000) TaxID=1068625 RepID=F9W676_TRYCI|nr:unnamed protein product [Trypanosoma congolense IL3000]